MPELNKTISIIPVNTSSTIIETSLPLKLIGKGKVRDIYEIDSTKLLIVTTDRLSAFDVVFSDPIPDKGKILNSISVFWFRKFESFCPHHLITEDIHQMGFDEKFIQQYGSQIEGRSMLVKRTNPLPVECVVRGYLSGSGWKDYQVNGAVCGHKLPQGLVKSQRLPELLFTPATKAVTGHDENISFEDVVKKTGKEVAEKIRWLSFEIYKKGSEHALGRGIIIADTKFEFGVLDGKVILIDEVMTPDSSRFWPENAWEAGQEPPSFDKQIARNYLLSIAWDQKPPAPKLPDDIIQKTSEAYKQVYGLLTQGDKGSSK